MCQMHSQRVRRWHGLQGQMLAHSWGHTLLCRSAPAPSLPLLDTKVAQAEHRSLSALALGQSQPWQRCSPPSPTPIFLWALVVPHAGQHFWERGGWRERVFCALWKVLKPFCPRTPAVITRAQGQCPDDGEGTQPCRAELQNSCPGCFLCFLQGNASLQYGTPLLSNQVSTAGTAASHPLGFPPGSSAVPSHPLKQKQWPRPHPVPVGLLKGKSQDCLS